MHPIIANVLLFAQDTANQIQEGLVTPAQQGLVEAGADPAAVGEEMAQPQPGFFARNSMWIMLLLIFGVMWLFMIRPQRKQQKEAENFRNSLRKGDKVVTIGGIFGEIVEVNETTALIKVDGDTKLRVSKNALQKDFTPQQ